jgi:phage I-like protein
VYLETIAELQDQVAALTAQLERERAQRGGLADTNTNTTTTAPGTTARESEGEAAWVHERRAMQATIDALEDKLRARVRVGQPCK